MQQGIQCVLARRLFRKQLADMDCQLLLQLERLVDVAGKGPLSKMMLFTLSALMFAPQPILLSFAHAYGPSHRCQSDASTTPPFY